MLSPRLLPLALLASTSIVAAVIHVRTDEPWPIVEPVPAVALRPARLEELDGLGCGQCHQSVVDEWAETSHAIAWQPSRPSVRERSTNSVRP